MHPSILLTEQVHNGCNKKYLPEEYNKLSSREFQTIVPRLMFYRQFIEDEVASKSENVCVCVRR